MGGKIGSGNRDRQRLDARSLAVTQCTSAMRCAAELGLGVRSSSGLRDASRRRIRARHAHAFEI